MTAALVRRQMSKRFSLIGVALMVAIASGAPEQSPQKSEPQFKLVQFHMAVLKRGPKWSAAQTPEREKLRAEHFAYLKSLLESGQAVMGGPLTDNTDILGIYVFRATTADKEQAVSET